MQSNPTKQSPCGGYQFNYTLNIDANGRFQVIDKTGRVAEAREVSGPLDAKRIMRVRTLSIVEVEGSHYLVIMLDGVLYEIPLPD